MSDAVLAVQGLVKEYPETVAVNGVDLSVRKGICFGLLGPNGAGKTTTIEMMEGITEPTDGRILYLGKPINASFSKVIGIQFQSTALQEFLTVKETLEMFRSLYPNPVDMDQLIQMCTLEPLLDRDNRKLSGGQRQRLLLALALVNDPEIIFLDEPTTGLDPQARRNFWDLIQSIKARQKTLILTTHYMEEAQLLCDEIAIMDHGRVIALDTPERLLESNFEGVLIQLPLLGNEGFLDELPSNFSQRNGLIEFITEDVDTSLQTLLRAGVSLTGLRIKIPTLEDLFLKLTGHSLRT